MINFLKSLNIVVFFLFFTIKAQANPPEFQTWLKNFKNVAMEKGVTKKTIDEILAEVRYLDQVIVYDNKQPEFFEKTNVYISKRASQRSAKKAKKKYLENKKIFEKVEDDFKVEKELLLALMGIETNFGTYVGKMDILSSLATLSFDKRRSEFFTNELITILRLVESQKIDHSILYGSWAGAFGNFQFMPSTIERYAIDYDNNNIIELKTTKDSFASAANYINKIGWLKNQPCFIKVNLTKNVPKDLLNTSAKKLHNKKKFGFLKKYIKNKDDIDLRDNIIGSIITPDKDIIPDSENLEPAYIVFENYEKILQWNRSLRFGLAVCTLKEKFENVL